MKVRWILLAILQQLQKQKVHWSLTVDLLVHFQQPQKPEILRDLAVDRVVDRVVGHLYPLERLRSSESKEQGRPELSRATVMGSLSWSLPFLPEEPQDRWVKMLAWQP